MADIHYRVVFPLYGATDDSMSVSFKSTDHHTLQSELRSCVKVEVAVLGSPSLTVRTVSVDVKQH